MLAGLHFFVSPICVFHPFCYNFFLYIFIPPVLVNLYVGYTSLAAKGALAHCLPVESKMVARGTKIAECVWKGT